MSWKTEEDIAKDHGAAFDLFLRSIAEDDYVIYCRSWGYWMGWV